MVVEKNNNNRTPINDCKMKISAFSMQGRRPHMEDYFDIGYLMKPVQLQKPNEWPYEYFYLGVFDGHGGSQAACFAKQNLLKFITKQRKFWSSNDDDVLTAIRDGFAETHEEMLQVMPSWTRTNRVLPSTAGTTASVLFIRNGKFYTGHVGDSRIVISSEHPETKNWRHVELTQDHKPENEIERIENAGGQVKAKIGVHRVVWRRPVLCKELEEKLTAEPKHPCYDFCFNSVASYPIDETLVDSYQTIPFLAIARSLGDFWSFNPDTEEYVVSPEPDVMCRPINESDKCILLATDGLWNVMNSSQAIRFLQELKIVKNGERNNKSYSSTYFATDNFYDVSNSLNEENHALSLVYMAYQIWERRRLRSDNITAIVAMLSDILTPQSTTSIHQTTGNDTRAYTEAYIAKNGFQLGQTRLVYQDVFLNKRPMFELISENDRKSEMLKGLEDYILFPPSIFELKSYRSYVKPPQNYFRLSNAKCRKLQRDDIDADQDEFIYVKEVSDDPADSVKLPTRKNSKNIEIRDSSAQATQSMHDFGQPWDQLVEKDVDTASIANSEVANESLSEATESFAEESSDEDDDNTDKTDTSDSDEIDYSIVDKLLDELPSLDEDVVEEHMDEIIAKLKSKISESRSSIDEDDDDDLDDQPTSPTIEQVLSVVSENRTPMTTRSVRKSATENPKRKLEPEMSTCPKTKRRKSHPIHTVAAAAVSEG